MFLEYPGPLFSWDLSKEPESGQEEAADQRRAGLSITESPANTLKAGSQVSSSAFYFCLEFQGSRPHEASEEPGAAMEGHVLNRKGAAVSVTLRGEPCPH